MSIMRRLRRVKILATLGPASQDPAVVKKLVQAGVDVFRINMSHTSHDMLQERVQTIRALEKEVGRPIGGSFARSQTRTGDRILYLTSARSGSIPVVSQSIMKPMVPVGASTVA